VRLQWIYQNIEEADPTLMVCAERRGSALVDLDWTIRQRPAGRVIGYDEVLAAEQAALLERAYGQAEDVNLFPAIEHLSSAFFRGHAHLQPHYTADGLGLKGFDCLNAWNLSREVTSGRWYWNPEAKEVMDVARECEEIPPGEVVHLVRSRHIDYPAMMIYLRSALGEKLWGQLLERYGIPPVIVVMPDTVDPNQVEQFAQSAQGIYEGSVGALPYGSSVHYASEARGVNPFKEFLSHQQELVVLMATGGMLTSLTGATGIGQGASDAHEKTWRTIVRRDAGLIATVLNRTVTDALLDRAFPGKPHLARFDFETRAAPTPAEVFDCAGKAVVAGYKVEKSELEERTGYRLIEAPSEGAFMEGATAAPFTPAAGLSPARQFLNREKAGNEKALKALARSLQLDFGPIAEALQTFFDAPSQAEAQRLIERLPELLPDDPQSAVILEQAIAEAYGDAVREDDEDVVLNKAEKCPECGRWLSASGACTDCAAADKAVAQGENPDSSEIKAAEIGKGKAAIKKCLETQKDVYDAISRSDLGMISFLYGNERMGLAHFQHRQETMEHLAETLILGQLGPTYQQGQKRNITYRGYTATLRLQDAEKGDKRESWVLTAFGPNDKK
jgi:phage gp29-like protein